MRKELSLSATVSSEAATQTVTQTTSMLAAVLLPRAQVCENDEVTIRRTMQRMNLESLPAYSDFPSGVDGRAYNEAAFRHFLAIERRRAEASMQSVLLVLVMVRRDSAANTDLPDDTAAAIFRGLGESVREVDFVGWFHEGRVAGAVLAQGMATTEKARQLMADRVVRTLRKRLPVSLSKKLRVRVVHLLSRSAAEPLNSSVARAVSG